MIGRPASLVPVALLVFAAAPRAHADAVPPAPENCPPGQVGTTSHGGPRCEKAPPKNCPIGWVGVIGGTCRLHTCSEDGHCQGEGGAKVCRDYSLCHQPKTRAKTCGALAPPPRSAEMAMVLPGACVPLEQPVTDWIPINVCGGAERCPSPSECRPGKLCVPASSPDSPNPPQPGVMPRTPSGEVDNRPSGCGS